VAAGDTDGADMSLIVPSVRSSLCAMAFSKIVMLVQEAQLICVVCLYLRRSCLHPFVA
jgi:hypothetical protein